MNLRWFVRAWNQFFFAPEAPTSIALFRVLYGALVTIDLLLLYPDWLSCFGPRGLLSLDTMHQMEPGTRITLFALIPASDFWVNALFWIFLLSAVLLTIGLMTRVSSVAVFLCLTSIQQRNLYIINSGDQLLRVIGFFLMFAPAGAALSVDRLIGIWKGTESAKPRPRSPWAQRLIQFELALVYFAAFLLKMQGVYWRNGTALYYVLHLDQFRRFPLPAWVQNPVMVRLETWMTLFVEFSLGVLVWFRKLRYPVLALGVLLHLSIEYSMNIALFEWIMLATYVTFIDPRDLARAWDWMRNRLAPCLPEPVTVVYDGSVAKLARTANLLAAIDVFRRLRIVDLRNTGSFSGITKKEARGRLVVLTRFGLLEGFQALQFAGRVLPLLWPLALAAFVRGFPKQSLRVQLPR